MPLTSHRAPADQTPTNRKPWVTPAIIHETVQDTEKFYTINAETHYATSVGGPTS